MLQFFRSIIFYKYSKVRSRAMPREPFINKDLLRNGFSLRNSEKESKSL